MLVKRQYEIEDPREVRRLVEAHGFATIVSADERGALRATHMPCLLDSAAGPEDRLTILGHLARADPQAPDVLAHRELLLVFQGPHGYVSAGWYGDGPYVSTWNYVAVHVRGTPQPLQGEEAFEVLRRTIERYESAREHPFELDSVLDYARRIAPGTVCFRLEATTVEAKAKLSQDKPAEVRDRVIEALDRPGPYHEPRLAQAMRHFGS